MKRPENIIESKEYIEPYCFENDQEAILFYAYLEQENYIDGLEKQFAIKDVSHQRELLFAYERFINEKSFDSDADIYKKVDKFLRK
jgi:hypothetical protein